MCELTLEDARMGTARTIKHNGFTFYVHIERDNDMRAPWFEYPEAHGIVIEDTQFGNVKVPRGARNLQGSDYYDWRASRQRAIKDNWGLAPKHLEALHATLGREPTKAEIIDAAVERDYQYCRSWACDEWEWKQIAVYLCDVDGHKVNGYVQYLGGIDGYGDVDAHIDECATDMADQIIAELDGKTEVVVKLK